MSMPRPKFEPTVNLGHILTFIGFMIGGFSAWVNLNSRIAILEEAKSMQVQLISQQKSAQAAVDQRQDVLIETTSKIQREDNKEINAKLDRLIERTMKK